MNNLNKLTDIELINEYKNGNNESIGVLYNRYYKKVYFKCFSYFKDRDLAFDMAQDSLLMAFTKIDGFRGDAAFSTWLFTVTSSICLQEIRRNKKKNLTRIDHSFEVADDNQSIRDLVDEEERRNSKMLNTLENIQKKDQKLLVDKYCHNLSIKELEKSLGSSSSAIKMRLSRAKKRVASLYYAQTSLRLT